MSEESERQARLKSLGDSLSGTGEVGNPVTRQLYEFGPYVLDPTERKLLRGNRIVVITPKAFDTLVLLVRNSGHLLEKDELIRMLWPGTFVEDGSLANNIFLLRKALGEDPTFIETVPRRGYRFIARVKVTAVGIAQPALSEAPPRHFKDWKRWSAITAIFAACAIVVLSWIFVRRDPAISSSPQFMVSPLTGSIAGEADPAFSPDGKQLAYVAQDDRRHNFNVYVKLIGAGQPLRLTSNDEQERFPAWSPDGRYLAFLRVRDQGSDDVYVIPAMGGSERRVASAGSYKSRLSWSPDGKLLAITDQTSSKDPFRIVFVSLSDGSKRGVTLPPADCMGDVYPAFSPDGRTLAFVRLRGAWGSLIGVDGDVYLQDISSNAPPKAVPRRLTFDNVEVAGFDWAADGHSIVFSSSRSGNLRLWRIGLDGSTAQPIAPGDNAVFPSVSSKGHRLAYGQHVLTFGVALRSSGTISQLKLSGSARNLTAAFCPSSQADISPQFSPDGARVVFASSRSGQGEIWICNSDGSNPLQLTSLHGFSGSPQWSPDMKKVAFDHVEGGHFDIWVVDVNQRVPLRLTSGNWNSVRPSWSNDGKWIYFSSDASGNTQLWRAPSQGGAPMQVTRGGGFEARESSDSRFVYYVKELDHDGTGIWRMPIGGGKETRVLDEGAPGLWALGLSGIYFIVQSTSSAPAVRVFNVTTHRTIQIALLPSATRLDTIDPAFAVSPDGQTILYGQAIPPGNIMVVENFR